MRIVFLIRSLHYGGAERQLVALAKGLKERGHSVLVAVFYPGGPLEKDLEDSGVPVNILDKHGRWDVFPFLWRLISLVRYEKPDILLGYLPVPNLLTVLLKPLLPRIKMVWGVRASNVDLSRYDWLVRVVFRIECFFSRFADLIIVNSRAGQEYHLKHGFPESKMVVVPNGIDTERFVPDPEARHRVRKEWGITDNEKLIGIVARLDPMKDYPTFLKAASLLAKERDDVRFVCVGDGPEPYKSELKRLAQALKLEDKLIWAGSRDDMPAVYNALDIASSSSSYGEGFPNVVGEAMACGVPCVVTDVGDSAWIIGDTGLAVGPKDPVALAKSISKMLKELDDNSTQIAEKVRTRIVENFSLSRLITNTNQQLLSLF